MNRVRLIRISASSLAAVFAGVGLTFLIIPSKVLAAFNSLADALGWSQSPTEAYTLYLALAVAYMYMVTVLAVQTFRHPEERTFPWMLCQAKAASSVLSIGLFALQEQYLLYLANFVVDGAIALYIWWLCLRVPSAQPVGRPAERDES